MKKYVFFDDKVNPAKKEQKQFDFFKIEEKKHISFISNLKKNYKAENLFYLLALIIVVMLTTSMADKINIFCYTSGLILGFKTSLKFKEHSDPPVALGKPLFQLLLTCLLLIIPTLINNSIGIYYPQ